MNKSGFRVLRRPRGVTDFQRPPYTAGGPREKIVPQEELAKEREALASKIDGDLLNRFERLFDSKGDAAVVAIEHGVCTGCHMKVTTATASRVKAGKEIVSCENCGRILYDAV